MKVDIHIDPEDRDALERLAAHYRQKFGDPVTWENVAYSALMEGIRQMLDVARKTGGIQEGTA